MKSLWVTCSLLLVAACDTLPEAPLIQEGGQAWQQHQAAVTQLKNWRIEGRLALQHGDESWNLNLQWEQHGEDYRIDMSGPFGAGRVQLQGNAHGVILRDADQRSFFANNPEELLYNQTGVIMPITDLRYWVLGLPAPYRVQQPFFDPSGRLARLQQAEWQINFRRYTQINQWPLPDKIFIAKHDKSVDVRLVVDEWDIPADQSLPR